MRLLNFRLRAYTMEIVERLIVALEAAQNVGPQRSPDRIEGAEQLGGLAVKKSHEPRQTGREDLEASLSAYQLGALARRDDIEVHLPPRIWCGGPGRIRETACRSRPSTANSPRTPRRKRAGRRRPNTARSC